MAIKVLVIPPDGEVSMQLIGPTVEAVSEIIFDGYPDGPVGEFRLGTNTIMLLDECAGDNAATTIPNPRATALYDTLTSRPADLDPTDDPLLGIAVVVGRDADGGYTSVPLDIMDHLQAGA